MKHQTSNPKPTTPEEPFGKGSSVQRLVRRRDVLFACILLAIFFFWKSSITVLIGPGHIFKPAYSIVPEWVPANDKLSDRRENNQ
jgi:hypothetical protein